MELVGEMVTIFYITRIVTISCNELASIISEVRHKGFNFERIIWLTILVVMIVIGGYLLNVVIGGAV